MVTLVNWLPANAHSPIVVTESGMVTPVNWLTANARYPIAVTGRLFIRPGIVTFFALPV
jgi:hypothetical protein